MYKNLNNLQNCAQSIRFENRYIPQDKLYYYDIATLQFCSSIKPDLKQSAFLDTPLSLTLEDQCNPNNLAFDKSFSAH